eukprot:9370497-Karenia_brevis.AAC.1
MTTVRKEDTFNSHLAQLRCKMCNRLRQRLATCLQDSEELKLGFKAVEGEERQSFYRSCKNMCGAELKKQVTECVIKSSYTKQMTTFGADGEFEDEEDVENRLQDKPQQLMEIKKNAIRFTDPLRKVPMLWIPKYKLSTYTEHGDVEEKKRRVESNHVVKPDKKPRKEPKENTGDVPEGGEGNALLKDIPETQIARLTKLVPKFESAEFEFMKVSTSARDPQYADYVPKKLRDACPKMEAEIAKVKDQYTKLLSEKKAPKGFMKEFFSVMKNIHDESSSLSDKIADLLPEEEEAAEENS